MKDVIIPDPNALGEKINIYDITNQLNGLVIGYFNDKPICYIQYDDDYGEYFAVNGISTQKTLWQAASNKSLMDLTKELIEKKVCNSFKVIEFEE